MKGQELYPFYVPEEGEPGHGALLGELERIFRKHQEGGRVTLRYETQVYFGRLVS